MVRHIYRRDHFRGLHKATMIKIGNWWANKELEQGLMEYCALEGIRFTDIPNDVTMEFLNA